MAEPSGVQRLTAEHLTNLAEQMSTLQHTTTFARGHVTVTDNRQENRRTVYVFRGDERDGNDLTVWVKD